MHGQDFGLPALGRGCERAQLFALKQGLDAANERLHKPQEGKAR